MDELLKKFKTNFPKLNIETKKINYSFMDENYIGKYYTVNGFLGNSDFQLTFEKEEDGEELYQILENDIYIFTDFLAIKYNNIIEILISPITLRTSLRIKYRKKDRDKDYSKFLELKLPYYKNNLKIEFERGKSPNNLLRKLMKFTNAKFSRKETYIVKISNYKYPTKEEIVNDIRNILNSILFDIEFTYDMIFETVNVEGLDRKNIRKKKVNELPIEPLNLIFKKYIPELIQYYHTAEKVDYLPFKFITYYHILEYFSDKSAYQVVAKEIKKILLKPDFHTKTNSYINQAVNVFKKENEKYTTDKIKLERVLRQFIIREDLKKELEELEVLEYFEKEIIINCVKPLKLPPINFDSDSNFYSNLRTRVYSLRNSIVHSNPDFDEKKAIPFIPSPNNINLLKTEIIMISLIAKNIITESVEE